MHRGVPVAEGEVDDRAVGVAHGPQDPDELGEAVEERPESLRALLAEHLDELLVLAPRLGDIAKARSEAELEAHHGQAQHQRQGP